MHPFWTQVVKPVLDAVGANTVVEIGSERGYTTRLLLDRAAGEGGTVIAIDPVPHFDVSAWELQWGKSLKVIRARSLDVIGSLPPVDAVLVDGDHNYFTVRTELEGLTAAAEARDQELPVFFIHDVGWPYGRRDLYYSPESIPFEHRHSASRAAIHPDRAETGEVGINAGLWNAVTEGGPRNGVLTAVEDFLSDHPELFRTIIVPGWHGLAILVPERTAARPEVAGELARLDSPGFLRRWASGLERARILAGIDSANDSRRARVLEVDRDQGLLD